MQVETKRFRDRLRLPLLVLIATHVVGTVGFWLVWRPYDATVFDALFMTFITIATIGYGEVHPLTTAGRLVAMAVAAGGIGTVGYTFGMVLDYFANEQLTGARRRYRMQKSIDALSGHFILAGMGRVGREAASEFTAAGMKWVLIDPNEAVVKSVLDQGGLALLGDATEDEVLRRAGLDRAAGLVVTTANDATNLYIVLTARLLNAKIFIVARAVDEATVPKMLRAGANKAMSPYAVGGRRLAHLLLNPRVIDFFETALRSGEGSLNISDVVLGQAVSGRLLSELQLPQKTGATVLVVLRGDRILLPKAELQVTEGDHLLALGTAEQLEQLEALIDVR